MTLAMKCSEVRRFAGRTLLLFAALPLHAEAPRLSPEVAAASFAAPATAAEAIAATRALVAAVTPAVVSVFAAQIMEDSGAASPLDRFFGRENSPNEKSPAGRDNQRVQGAGSGVILTADGWIVTNSHVVHFQSGKLADAISVELADHRHFDAQIAGVDPLTDLALLKITAQDLNFLSLADSAGVQVGDEVLAVGNPFRLGSTATRGMVSALRRSSLGLNGAAGYESFIQTDAPINPGNSGGALIDTRGRLAGINTAIWGGMGGNVGIGFAIPSDMVRNVITQLAVKGRVDRGFFGWQIAEVTRTDAEKAGLAAVAGAKIEQVRSGGPAAAAGLVEGDIVTRAGERPVFTRGDLRVEASLVEPGGTLVLTFQRTGAAQQATLTAGKSAEDGASGATAGFRMEALPGVDFRKGPRGLTVEKIPAALSAKTGLAAGMEIVEINGTTVTDAASAEKALQKGVNKVKTVSRGDEETFAVRLPLEAKDDG
jgi:S1-C subfamily serine protease